MPRVDMGLGLDRCHCGGRIGLECDRTGRVLQYCERCSAVSSAVRTPLLPLVIPAPALPPCQTVGCENRARSPHASICMTCTRQVTRAAKLAREAKAAGLPAPAPLPLGTRVCTQAGCETPIRGHRDFCEPCALKRRRARQCGYNAARARSAGRAA